MMLQGQPAVFPGTRPIPALTYRPGADKRQPCCVCAQANGHGSNMPNLDLAARRTNLETDADCILAAWWNMLTVDKDFLPRWRQSKFPGGCAHACELETSLYLYLDGDNVRKDKIKNGDISFNEENNPFCWNDLFAAGPATKISWTSSYSETGV